MVVEDDVTLVPTVETDRCMIYQYLEVTGENMRGRFYSVNRGHLIQTQQTRRENWIQQVYSCIQNQMYK